MTIYLHIVNDSPVRLWGLTSRERLLRLLRREGEVQAVEDPGAVPADASVVLLRGDYLFDQRVLHQLLKRDNLLLQSELEGRRREVGAHVPARLAAAARDRLSDEAEAAQLPDEIRTATPEDLSGSFQEQLLKSAPPFALPITRENRGELEHLLFGSAYKGITDLVTKWLWPIPARWGVRFSVRLGLRPNHVTALSWLLAITAGLLFWGGDFGWGLAAGWLMTYLDTVDGKLARVTLTSSPFGHLFDHILDVLHPPFWYLAWGLGLAFYQPLLLPGGLETAIWVIFAGYIAGRLVEGAFQLWLGSFGIFCWRRIDSYSRLVTARRNPCLILLTIGALGQRPDLGLEAVAVWTFLSSAFLLLRLLTAGFARASTGPLTSWLADMGRNGEDRSLAVRWFARGGHRPVSQPPR